MSRRILERAQRWRFIVFGAWICFWVPRFYSNSPRWGDWWVFEFGARVFAKVDGSYYANYPGGALHIYQTMPKLQVGPPALVLAIPSQLIFTPLVGRQVMAGILAGLGLVVIWLAERVAVRSGRDLADVRRVSLAAGVALVPLWCALAVRWMHLDDATVLVLLEVALLTALRRRWFWMGIALGCAIAAKPWAIGYLPLVLMLPWPNARRAAMVAVASAALWWLPFLLAAPSTASSMSDVGGIAQIRTLWRTIGFQVQPTGGRELQFAVSMLACALVVRRGRWWAAPVVATALRLALDWQAWLYYDASLLVCAVICDLCDKRRGHWPWVSMFALLTATVIPLAETIAMPPDLAAILRLALLATTAGVAFGRRVRVESPVAELAWQPEPDNALA